MAEVTIAGAPDVTVPSRRSRAEVIDLGKFRKSPKAARKMTTEERLRNSDQAMTAISYHLLMAARIISGLNSTGAQS